MFGKRIYLDYASLMPVDKAVLREMNRYSGTDFFNPASLYREGVNAKEALLEARKSAALFLRAHPDEIFFTSGGTESNNIAIVGAVEKIRGQGIPYDDMHILISAIEHSSVRECANALGEKGVAVEVIPVDGRGLVDLAMVRKMIRPNTVIVSVMTVNNEIGTIQPIREIAKAIRHARGELRGKSVFDFQETAYPLFHSDAAQAVYEDLHVERLGVDLLTLDAAKCYGPRGAGLLYKKKSIEVSPIVFGGGQEKGLRSGTENLPAIMGFKKALEIVSKSRDREIVHLARLKSLFLNGLRGLDPRIAVNGDEKHGSPHILNVEIPGIESEFFIFELDARGIAASTKSSCLRDEDESYVLKMIGARSDRSVRFSFGRMTTEREIRKAISVIKVLFSRRRV